MGLLDRYGEPLDDDPPAEHDTSAGHDARCVGGWLPDAADGRAVACPTCKPHLTGRRERLARLLGGLTP